MAIVRVAAVQTGPADPDVEKNLAGLDALLGELEPVPDLVVLPELFALPFWCVGLTQQDYFGWAEDHKGPTIAGMRALAQKYAAHMVVPFFERGSVAGQYYNSAAVISDVGELVPGTLPTGQSVGVYRKSAISSYRWDEQTNDEKFYFRPGPGYPVFRTRVGVLGVLICYDRWYPEAWRVLALQGAQIICVLNSSQGDVSDLFVPSMRTSAAQNLVYVIATNRSGIEVIEGQSSRFYGLTCIIGPRGDVLAQAGEATPDEVITADLDLERVVSDRTRHTMYRDRRPELYGLLTQEDGVWGP